MDYASLCRYEEAISLDPDLVKVRTDIMRRINILNELAPKLVRAVKHRSLTKVKALLLDGADPNLMDPHSKCVPLDKIALVGCFDHYPIIQKLLDRRQDVAFYNTLGIRVFIFVFPFSIYHNAFYLCCLCYDYVLSYQYIRCCV